MRTIEDVERDLEALRRRGRILGYAILAAGLALLVVGIMVITSPSEPTRDLDYLDVVTASA